MKWLANNMTTIGMAIVLSLLTIGLLTKPNPEDEDPPLTLQARFMPEVRASVGSLEFEVEDRRLTDTIPVTVSGDRSQIQVLASLLTCQPILDESKFPSDSAVRETTVEITAKDFNLNSEQASRIRIKPIELRIKFAPMVSRVFPIQASVEDVVDRADVPRFRVEGVRAIPPEIRVRLPVDKADKLSALPIRPIRMKGRLSSFTVEGSINTDLPDTKDVRTAGRDVFLIAVDLRPILEQVVVEGVPLHLSAPPIPGHVVEVIDKLKLKVVLEGPRDLLDQLTQNKDQVHVYVKLDWGDASAPGSFTLPIRCELVDEVFRRQGVRASLAPGESSMAAVRVVPQH